MYNCVYLSHKSAEMSEGEFRDIVLRCGWQEQRHDGGGICIPQQNIDVRQAVQVLEPGLARHHLVTLLLCSRVGVANGPTYCFESVGGQQNA